MQTAHVVMLIAYLLLMVAVGAYFSRTSAVRTGDDFMFAGRRLPRVVLIGTLLATWVGSGTIIGGANFAYQYGPFAAMIFFGGTPLGILVLYFAAGRLHTLSRHTVPELLELRFGHGVRLVGTVIILLAYAGITAYQFLGGGYIISLVTPLSSQQGTALVAVVVTFLAVSGGLFTVAWTDFLSAVLIVVSLVVSVPIVLAAVGSPSDFLARLPDQSRSVSGGLGPVQLLGYFLPLLLLVLADQNMYQRLAAAKDQGTARKSAVGFFIASFLITIPVAILAAGASILLPRLADPDTAVLSLASEGLLPAVLGGVLLGGCLAFIVTTATSFMLSVGGNLLYDVYLRHARREIGEVARLRLHRVAVLLVAVLAYVVGRFFPTVLELQVYSYTVYGVAVTPAVLAVLFWPRATTAGALASMVLGTGALLVWEFALGQPRGWNAVVVALPAAVVGLVVGSLLTTPDQQRQRHLAAAMGATEPEEGDTRGV